MTCEPYRPSNGTEGDIFYGAWCARCQREAARREDPDSGDGCEIYLRSMAFGINDPSYPEEWVTDGGDPACLAFEEDGVDRLDPAAVLRPLL